MGIFGAVGRETKGAMRSLGYDMRHSKRFRRLGTLAVLTVAGGVMATGAVLRSPVPEMMGIETDQEGSGVTDNWFGFGSDTRGQDAEPSPSGGGTPGGDPVAPEPPTSSPTGDRTGTRPLPEQEGAPGLTPIDDSDEPSSPAESGSTSPAPEPTLSPEPSEEPTPSETPTASPSPSPTVEPDPTGTPG